MLLIRARGEYLEGCRARERGDRLVARVDKVGIDEIISRKWANSMQTVLRLEGAIHQSGGHGRMLFKVVP